MTGPRRPSIARTRRYPPSVPSRSGDTLPHLIPHRRALNARSLSARRRLSAPRTAHHVITTALQSYCTASTFQGLQDPQNTRGLTHARSLDAAPGATGTAHSPALHIHPS